jgi:YHS domain-containing protein
VKDPVCGMWIQVSDAAGSTTYESQPVYFCSDQCRRDFESDPARYYDRLERRRNRITVTNGELARYLR